ncbi:MAG: efflux RND transporter periplasmic adaptor subunit [Colwellia polaris]|jgi:Cu(I)/Ag(I) efflux system membrane fusion protein|uniref:efflux RND transporter periplasmic adaptor subunit n=1 Tax=Colwellia polaris TaxID=326537 RepID=UPI000A17714A|nr:efflux RND transporter periplasmic adaptor subunit [Colwellia polaris]|tara:strand:+ start:6226 stop:8106 length:1881 start_codon:yes stop_codon:yes gene_type:complete
MSNTINKNLFKPVAFGILLGGLITGAAFSYLFAESNGKEPSASSAKDKPLYWVAPMDANYRRDKAGKSPMGMDLVPVYQDSNQGPDAGVGTIRISSDVINNLGVRTSTAKIKPLHAEINTVGYIAYDEEKMVHIHPRVEGWVEKLYVQAVGESVTKNQALYEIYSPELVNAQEELVLALNRSNRQLIKAAENRLLALQIPQSAISQLIKTKQVQQTITFYSPQNGVVETLNIREGFYVQPGLTVMSIADLSQVWVEAEVFERQANQVKAGAPVTMTLDYLPGQSWQGQVDLIYPTLDVKTRTVKLRLRFSNEKGAFKPNMFAQIAIHSTDADNTLLIPKEALIRTGKQDRVVLALGEGSFKSIAVTVGRYDNENVEIITGLSEGDKVVSSAQFLLDSESSKSSDFKRMYSENEGSDATASEEPMPVSVWVQGEITNLMAGHKMLTLEHEAIPQWDWPEMVMDFLVIDSVDFSRLKLGLTLHVEISKTAEGDYIISNIHIPDTPSAMDSAMEMGSDMENESIKKVSSATVTGTINSLMKDHGMINISRSAIEKWNRPAATVDFITAKNVSLANFNEGMQVSFTFEIRDGDFVIIDISPLSNFSTLSKTEKNNSEAALNVAPIDHSNH